MNDEPTEDTQQHAQQHNVSIFQMDKSFATNNHDTSSLDLLDQQDNQNKLTLNDPEQIKFQRHFQWKDQLTVKLGRMNEDILNIREKTKLEKIEEFNDRYPCLYIRKNIIKFRLYDNQQIITYYRIIVEISSKIIQSVVFEYITLLVIVSNSIFLALDDPTSDTTSTFRETLDTIYSSLYFTEFVLKVFGMGFIFNQGAYLRDYWNILDFSVIVQMAVQILIETKQIKLNVLRAFRVLRPLRTITSIEGLKLLVAALISALPLLRDTLIILAFFFMIFGIAGLQVFSGDLKNRCIKIETGVLHSDDLLCGSQTACPPGYFCGQKMMNPNLGMTNYDTIFYSLLTVFQCVTLEGWSYNMINEMQVTHQLVFLFFIPLVYIGAYFFLNLTLAVINYKFNEAHKFYQEKKKDELQRKQKQLDSGAKVAIKSTNLLEDIQQLEEKNGDETIKIARNSRKSFGMTVRQFIIAKKAAGKMIVFLRTRQRIKQIQREKRKTSMKIFIAKLFTNERRQTKYQGDNQSFGMLNKYNNQFQFEIQRIPISKDSFNTDKSFIDESKNEQSEPIDTPYPQFQNINNNQSLFKRQENIVRQINQPSIVHEESVYSESFTSEENNQQHTESLRASESSEQDGLGDNLRDLLWRQKRPMTQNVDKRNMQTLVNSQSYGQYNQRIQQNYNINNIYSNSKLKQMNSTQFQQQSRLINYSVSYQVNNLIRNSALNLIKANNEPISSRIDEFEFESIVFNDNLFENSQKDQESVEQNNPQEQFLSDVSSQNIQDYEGRRFHRNQQINNQSIEESLLRTSENNTTTNAMIMDDQQQYNYVTYNSYQNAENVFRQNQDLPQNNNFNYEERKEYLYQPFDEEYQEDSTLRQKPDLNFQTQHQAEFPMIYSKNSKEGNLTIIGNDLSQLNYNHSTATKKHETDYLPIKIKKKKAPRIKSFDMHQFDEPDIPESLIPEPLVRKQTRTMQRRKTIFDAIIKQQKLQKKDTIVQKSLIQDMINYKTQKIVLNEHSEFLSSSHFDIFQNRIAQKQKKKVINPQVEKFLKNYQVDTVKPKWKPYQLRIIYNVKQDEYSSQILEELMQNDEFREFQEQPYETISQIGYKHVYEGEWIQHATKRSDFYLTSTLSFTLIPKSFKEDISNHKVPEEESQQMKNKNLARKSKSQIIIKEPEDGNFMSIVEKIKLESNIISSRMSSNSPEHSDAREKHDQFPNQLQIHQEPQKSIDSSMIFPQENVPNQLVSNSSLRINSPAFQHNVSTPLKIQLLQTPNEKYSRGRVSKQNSFVFENSPSISLMKREQSQQINLIPVKSRQHSKIYQQSKKVSILDTSYNQNEKSPKVRQKGQELLHKLGMLRRGSISGYNDIQPKSINLRKVASIIKQATLHHTSNKLTTQEALSPAKVKKYKEKDLQRKKDKLQRMTVLTAKNFFQGNFYSSDEEDKKSQVSKNKHRKNQSYDRQSQFKESQASSQLKAMQIQQEEKGQINQLIDSNDPFNIFIARVIKSSKIQSFDTTQNICENPQIQDQELSDVPSSLCSDYEELKREQKREIIQKNYSKTFGRVVNEVKSSTNTNIFDFKRLRKKDWRNKKHSSRWSAQDVLPESLTLDKAKYLAMILSSIQIWPYGIYGILRKIRKNLKQIVLNNMFENLMTICVIINTIILALDNYNVDPQLDEILVTFNEAFTYIFCIELGLKIIGIGVNRYFRDMMNYLDLAVVIMSIIELVLNFQNEGHGGSSLSAFRVIRIFRTFRVLRVARLLRSLHSMQIIIGVMQRSVKSFIYIAMLLFLLIYIYALLGMCLFGDLNKFETGIGLSNNNNGPLSRGNYDTFNNAFVTTFQVLTMENWQNVLYDTMFYSTIPKPVTVIFYISWIFVGNFILLNLFLAILLDSFLEEEEEEEEKQKIENERKKEFQKNTQKNEVNQKKTKSLKQSRQKNKSKTSLDLLALIQNPKYIRSHSIASHETSEQPSLLEVQDLNDLDFEDKLSLLNQSGIFNAKKAQKLQTIDELFRDVYCEKSFYLLQKHNTVRLIAMRIVKHRYFERLIILIILMSSIKLAIDTYYLDQEIGATSQVNLRIIDLIFTIIFAFEAVIKIVAFGFIVDQGSYLREYWNLIDFFIVVTSVLDALLSNFNMPAIKVLRLLRTLRPLRFISHNIAMKTLVTALIESIGSIINVIVVVMIVWFMFAILGVSLYSGKMFYCSTGKYEYTTKQQCLKERGEWVKYDSNFDDIYNAMLTLFILSSQENWNAIMYQAVDIQGEGQGPAIGSSPGYAYFFIIFMLVGSFFFLNLFVGVLFLNFKNAQKGMNSNGGIEALDQRKHRKNRETNNVWRDMQKMIVEADPDFETTNLPKNQWRQKVHQIVTNSKFDIAIMVCICLNMIQMSLLYDGCTPSYQKFLDNINLAFTLIYIIEMILKLLAFGVSYFKYSWNKFDFTIIMISIIEFLISQIGETSSSFLKTAPQVVRILRVLRVSRILRLVGKYEGLQALLSTIVFSLPPLLNVFSLLMLIFFIFAILGVFMFRNVEKGQVIDDQYTNFSNFGFAMLMMFKISTGEDWNMVMFDTMKQENCAFKTDCVTPVAPIYFASFVIICSYVMLNLFVLIILEQFDKYYLPKDNIIAKFKRDLLNFKNTWKNFTMDRYNCIKIRENQLLNFFRNLKEPLGLPNIETDHQLQRIILQMGIRSEKGYIYFNEMLYRCMKRVYGNFKLDKEMQIFELKTQYKIQQKTLTNIYKYSLFFKKNITQQALQGILYDEQKHFNPFLSQLQIKFALKSWLKLSQGEIDENQALEEIEYDSDETILISDDDDQSELLVEELKSERIENTEYQIGAAQEMKMELQHSNTQREKKLKNKFIHNRQPRKSITLRESFENKMEIIINKVSQLDYSEDQEISNISGGFLVKSPTDMSSQDRGSRLHKRSSLGVEIIKEEEDDVHSPYLKNDQQLQSKSSISENSLEDKKEN